MLKCLKMQYEMFHMSKETEQDFPEMCNKNYHGS